MASRFRLYLGNRPAGAGGITGTLSATLGALTAAGTGSNPIAGTSSAMLGLLTLAGAGGSGALATADITLGELTAVGAGSVADAGPGPAPEVLPKPPGRSTRGRRVRTAPIRQKRLVPLVAAGAATLGDLTAAGAGRVWNRARARGVLPPLRTVGAGSVAIMGAGRIPVGGLGVSSAVAVDWRHAIADDDESFLTLDG
jgi:PPE-repeat protein